MGKHKGGSFSLFDSYMANYQQNSTNMSDNAAGEQAPSLPDSMRVSTLLEQIGCERSWSQDQIDNDLRVLDRNRLYFIRDLRSLSNYSWQVIDLLPLVRDLLREAVTPGWDTEQNYYAEKMKKKAKKKEKKEKKAARYNNTMIGEPVQPDTTRTAFRNGASAPEKGEKEEKQKNKKDSEKHSSSSSSSSSSESSDSASEVEISKGTSQTTSTFSGRPIQAVDNQRIRVRTASGAVYECDRFCPHKKVDLTAWGQVMGNTLICTKHNWKFSLEGGGSGPKGRTVHPCRVNDW
ncbi:hypothetical protein BCR43DRAFT_498480 [Syncephalastrum racemosum]|uniref:Rieske domain-containing protein n=1 Tax=Syncephalastrum racemosum TaxID=13706 RepID=A0A1X2H242_SYNRA|nr:hypothetical protein BCR43DRAFT_498480 [Syncephalastrum racemosum]